MKDLQQRLNECKGALFDNDGTLVDTEAIKVDVFTYVAKEQSGVELTDEDKKKLYGRLDLDCYVEFVQRYGLRHAPLELLGIHTALYNERLKTVDKALPGVQEALERFEMMAIPIGICSGSERDQLDIIYASLGWHRFFKHITSAESTKEHKPHPAPYIHAADGLGIAPARLAAFEDSRPGVTSAKEAEIGLVVGVSIGNHGTQDLSNADYVIPRLDALFV